VINNSSPLVVVTSIFSSFPCCNLPVSNSLRWDHHWNKKYDVGNVPWDPLCLYFFLPPHVAPSPSNTVTGESCKSSLYFASFLVGERIGDSRILLSNWCFVNSIFSVVQKSELVTQECLSGISVDEPETNDSKFSVNEDEYKVRCRLEKNTLRTQSWSWCLRLRGPPWTRCLNTSRSIRHPVPLDLLPSTRGRLENRIFTNCFVITEKTTVYCCLLLIDKTRDK
jgi:hypothetical protein